ncbi:MAG: protein TolQ [Gammaproteobacteria bacterium]|nr:protein TolQ [Gammaproteobacteria bacterium]MCP4474411.1 protein TolQ [Gammaproteobacteria bacterium]
MTTNASLWGYVWHASLIVKLVMLLLLMASIASWTVIFQRGALLKRTYRALDSFEGRFWLTENLNHYYQQLSQREDNHGLESLFSAGFKEFLRLHQQPGVAAYHIMEGSNRAMRVANSREIDHLELGLPFLATVGSVSPYIGLFGTVWGIMITFHALGGTTQATMSMVAPGISEALIATAMGLFAAIPAVIGYNRYAAKVDRIAGRYEAFQEEFANFLYRRAQLEPGE